MRRPVLRQRVWVPLLVLVVIGAALRLVVELAYDPAVLYFWDSAVYLHSARVGVFDDAARNAGYPLFLRALHAITSEFSVTIAVQHVLGVVSALLLYATVRRLGAPRWFALIPAAAVLLSGDVILFEHSVLTESLFTTLVIASFYALVRASDSGGSLGWLVATGLAFGAASYVRTFWAPFVIFAVAWLLLTLPGGWRGRLAKAGTVLGVCFACLLAYAFAQQHYVGDFGITRTGGWSLYARVGQFADCSKFTPPAGTRKLCESAPPEQRGGPRFHFWEAGSPARALYGGPPHGDAKLGAFAKKAILAQPGDYLDTVATDAWRYVAPNSVAAEGAPTDYRFDVHSAGPERYNLRSISFWYAGSVSSVESTDGDVLEGYHGVMRVHGWLVLVALVLALAGVVLARGRRRFGVLLLLLPALGLYLLPVATLTFNWRYGVPAAVLLVAAASLAAAEVARRFAHAPRRSEPEPTAERRREAEPAPAG